MDPLSLQTALKMTIALGVVLLVFAATVFAFKKISGKTGALGLKSKKARGKPIDVLAFSNLGPGKTVYVIKCFGKNLVLGVSPQNIQMLCELDDLESSSTENIGNVDFNSSLSEHMPHDNEKKFREKINQKFKDMTRV
ncbi:MAG: flagellar biosynthetic protein FliO [Proteobacteria bacterium]|nr:flagellar biosynthetic protein FliO [Pseudomonadota bacterium]